MPIKSLDQTKTNTAVDSTDPQGSLSSKELSPEPSVLNADKVDKSDPQIKLKKWAPLDFFFRRAKATPAWWAGFEQMLALTGLRIPKDFAKDTAKKVTDVVTKATHNAENINKNTAEQTFLDPETLAKFAEVCLGVNSGNDEVVEGYVHYLVKGQSIQVSFFDRAGFEVFDGDIRNGVPITTSENSEALKSQFGPGTVYVNKIRASHGRNAIEIDIKDNDEHVPGRGNALLIAKAFEALIGACLENGVYQIVCAPASNDVRALYLTMGFRPASEVAKHRAHGKISSFKPPVLMLLAAWAAGEKGRDRILAWQQKFERRFRGPNANALMVLNLRDEKAVWQALAVFQAFRSKFKDVPKDVVGGSQPRLIERKKECELYYGESLKHISIRSESKN